MFASRQTSARRNALRQQSQLLLSGASGWSGRLGRSRGSGVGGGRSLSRSGRGHRRLFAVREPDIVDGMLNPVQPRARGEHPAREDALDLALQRDLVHLDEGIGIGCFGRRSRVADPRGDLQSPELHCLPDCRVEIDDATGDLVQPREYGALVLDLLRRGLRNNLIARLWRCVCRLRRAARRLLSAR